MKKTVLGAGLLAVDHIFLAQDGSRTPKSYKYLGSAGGGSVPNILCFLSLLGYNTYVFGVTGNDICERILKDDFKQFGVDYSFISKRGDKDNIKITRQYSHVILQNGGHKFLDKCIDCTSAFKRDYQISKSDVNNNLMKITKDVELLIIDRSNEATLSLANIVYRNNGKIAYDWGFFSYGKYLNKTEKIIKMSNIVKTNDSVFKRYMKGNDDEAILRWWEKYPNLDYLFVTNGNKGVYGYAKFSDGRNIFRYDAIPTENLKDASGSGDILFGFVLSELILKKTTFGKTKFKNIVNLGQSLASLNCTLYGARSLQRTFLKQKVSKKEIIEIAKNIASNNKSGNSFSPLIGLPQPLTGPFRLKKLSGCDICGQLYKNRIKINKSRRSKIPQINKNLSRLPWSMRNSFEIGKAYRKRLSEIREQNALFIGSGGSYSASVFGEILYLHSLQKMAKAITPYEFEGIDLLRDEVAVWFISHGGNNSDILGAALHAKELKYENVNILTSGKNSKLAELSMNNNWNSVFIKGEERNFVSIIGYLSQISALAGILATENEVNRINKFFNDNNILSVFTNARRTMKRIAQQFVINGDTIQDHHIIGLGRGWGWPALIDFESKIVEGGICTIEISELKNYTHGRYINTYGRDNRRVILYQTPEDKELVEYLCKRFKNRVEYFVISTDEKGIVGGIELLIHSILLAYYLGSIAKKDILSPRYPPEARGLYSWEPENRKNYWKKDESKENKIRATKLR